MKRGRWPRYFLPPEPAAAADNTNGMDGKDYYGKKEERCTDRNEKSQG